VKLFTAHFADQALSTGPSIYHSAIPKEGFAAYSDFDWTSTPLSSLGQIWPSFHNPN
jgi:hypothetical protein